MPKPNEGDLFYDIEGYPLKEGRGFEYLHGVYHLKKQNDFKIFGQKYFEFPIRKEANVKINKIFQRPL